MIVRPGRRWLCIVGVTLAGVVALALLFRWDWLIPVIEAQARGALKRPVTIGHLHVRLGRTVEVSAEDVAIGNPSDWPDSESFASAKRLTVAIDAETFIKDRSLRLPLIQLDKPVVDAQELEDHRDNWSFGGGSGAATGNGPTIQRLIINDGQVRVRAAPLAADFRISIHSTSGTDAASDRIVADAKGTYARQPISADFIGGSLLSLQDHRDPYPVDLKVQNGSTGVSMKGTVDNLFTLSGLDGRLELHGPDMSLLLPLTGIAIPKTPPYTVDSHLKYGDGLVRLNELVGKVGKSDLNGTLLVDTRPTRPDLVADLRSNLVDLTDLGGFIGAEPGDGPSNPKADRQPHNRVLPDQPISLPRLNVADVHLKYSARRIEGRRQPLDDMSVVLTIVNGDVSLTPLRFDIGRGAIISQIHLSEQDGLLGMKADIDFNDVDVSKLLNATGVARGAGSIGGRAVIEGKGASIGEILGAGNGEIKLHMGSGGDLSGLIVDLSGLEFGNALLSALGIPTRERIECLISDVSLQNGLATSRLTMLDTNDSRVGISGQVNLKTEHLDLTLRTQSKHFSIGSLPAPIGIDGTLGRPNIEPDLKEGGARAAAAVGLGVLLTPIAGLLPTIQFGIGDDHACAGLLKEIASPPRHNGRVTPLNSRAATRSGEIRHR